MSRCVIISACPVSASLASALRPGDTIIACDAGYRNCAPLHCRPDIIVGDFDTAPCPEQEGDDTIILPHVKDDTDTEYAAKLASEKGFDEALLLGVLGGRRLEHTLANLCTGLGLEQRGVRATLLDERSRITFVMPGETRRYPKDGYFYLSVFPMEGRAEGVSERGSFYELTDAVLTAGISAAVAATARCLVVVGHRPHRRLPPRRQQRVCRGLRLHHHLHPKGCAGGGGDGAGRADPELNRNIPGAGRL